MKVLNNSELLAVNGGLLDQGNGAGAGSSAGNTYGTAAIKGDSEKAKKDICKASSLATPVSAAVNVTAGVIVGTVAAYTCNF